MNRQIKWHRDCKTEEMLQQRSIAYHYDDKLRMSMIDGSASQHNQRRLTPRGIDDDNMLRCALAVENNRSLPALVVHKKGQKLVVDDGLHRYEGIKYVLDDGVAEQPLAAYVLDTDDEWMLDFVASCLNQLNGLSSDREQRINGAMEALRKHPTLTQRYVAECFDISKDRLSRRIHAERVRNRLEDRGHRCRDLSISMLAEIGKISGNEVVMDKATNVISSRALNLDQAKDLVKRTKAKRTEATQLQAVVDYDREIAQSVSEKTRGQKALPKKRIRNLLQKSLAFLSSYPTFRHWGVTSPDEKTLIRKQVHQLTRLFNKAVK